MRAAKARAVRAGVPFNITTDDISIPHECPVLGIPLIVGANKASDNSPSLDRVPRDLSITPLQIGNAIGEQSVLDFLRHHFNKQNIMEG